jgi:hypothetical protein
VVVVLALSEFSFDLLGCSEILFVGGFRWVGSNNVFRPMIPSIGQEVSPWL